MVKNIFDKNPVLKKNVNIKFYLSDNFTLETNRISKLLNIAVTNNDVKMLDILYTNDANLDLESFTGAQDKPIDVAVENCRRESLNWLLDHGAKLHTKSFFIALNNKQNERLDFDFLISLLETNVTFKFWDLTIDISLFCKVAAHYNENPEKCKALLALMLEKGAGKCIMQEYKEILMLNKNSERYMSEEQKRIVQPVVIELLQKQS